MTADKAIDAEEKVGQGEKGKRLQTVERALEVLYLFHEYNGITLSFVIKKLNMGTTVAYRLLYTLTACGFLRQEHESKRYFLGEKSLLLGYQAIKSQGMKEIAVPVMKQLEAACRLDVLLTVCADMKSLCVEKIDVGGDLQLAMREGGIYPLHKGASNRPLLAFAEADFREGYIRSLELSREDSRKLEADLEAVKEKGYDYTQGGLSQGLFAIGFPVYAMEQGLAACLSVGGCCFDMKEEQKNYYVGEVRTAAAHLSRLLGAG